MALPRFIALCGQPKSGKSLVQEVLAKKCGARPIDSGLPLREIGMKYFGLTRHQVFTQEGKLEFVEILGRKWQVREFLGELGNRLESMHGNWVLPFMVTRTLPASNGPFCDASCRRNQGDFYKSLGSAVIIGIRRRDVPDSPYEFDTFKTECVDHWIENDALANGLSHAEALADLEAKVDAVIERISL
jgi:hypothetical protein